MLICEILLISTMVILGSYVINSDVRKGIVENRAVALGMLFGVIINTIYYSVFAASLFKLYIVNLAIISGLSVLFYAWHYWAAGDSKLLIAMTILIPGRLYDNDGLSIPGISYVIIIFLVAYLYIIAESVTAYIRREKFYHGARVNIRSIPSIIVNYAAVLCLLSIVSLIWSIGFKDFYRDNHMIFSLFSVFLVSYFADIKFLKQKCILILLACGAIVLFIAGGLRNQLYPWLMLRNYVIVIGAIFIRHFVSGYNYQEIPTSEVRTGMVLAYTSVLLFQGSTIKDLPASTSEDMRDRINDVQAEAIHRWGKSKKGRPSIVIVRKMPFAIFIVFGILLYILIRVV